MPSKRTNSGLVLPDSQYLVPTVIEKTPYGERAFDIYSRLLKERIIFLGSEVNEQVASLVIAQLILLDNEDPKRDIYMYIDSPGGSVTAGMAIYDTMKYIRPNIVTICLGLAASMGAMLLSAGTKGKRLSLPHSNIMIHQVLLAGGGIGGQATDIEIEARFILRLKKQLNVILADETGQTLEKVERDTERNFWMTPQEAKDYGLIDRIIAKKQDATKAVEGKEKK